MQWIRSGKADKREHLPYSQACSIAVECDTKTLNFIINSTVFQISKVSQGKNLTRSATWTDKLLESTVINIWWEQWEVTSWNSLLIPCLEKFIWNTVTHATHTFASNIRKKSDSPCLFLTNNKKVMKSPHYLPILNCLSFTAKFPFPYGSSSSWLISTVHKILPSIYKILIL